MVRITAVVALLLGLVGCGSADPTDGPAPPTYVGTAVLEPAANEDPRFWDYRLRDVVSLADHVVLVTVVRSRPVTWRASEEDGGDLTFTRRTLRVDRVVWSREGAPPAPRTIRADDIHQRPLEGTYVVPVVRTRGWDVLTGTSYLATSTTRPAPTTEVGPEDEWRQGVAGLGLGRLRERLAGTRPWPGITPDDDWRERVRLAGRHFG